MNYIVYPAVLEKDDTEKAYVFNFHDLNLIAAGVSIEQAFLRACEDFQDYISFAAKFKMSFAEPTPFADFEKLNPKKKVMLFKAVVEGENVKVTGFEQAYKSFVESLIE